jgi:signal transduction histidine kinase/GAF domain-containing protein
VWGGALAIYYAHITLNLRDEDLFHWITIGITIIIFALTFQVLHGLWETRALRSLLSDLFHGQSVPKELATKGGSQAVTFAIRHNVLVGLSAPVYTIIPACIYMDWAVDASRTMLIHITIATLIAIVACVSMIYFAMDYMMRPVLRHLANNGIDFEFDKIITGKLQNRLMFYLTMIILVVALMIAVLANQRAADLIVSPFSHEHIVYNLRLHTIAITCVAVLIAIIMAVLLARSIGTRIKTLVETMHRAEIGDLPEQIEAFSNDELGAIGRGLNSLIKKLHESHATLEDQVAERTVELSEVNKELRAEIKTRKEAEDALRKSEETKHHFQQKLTTLLDISNQLTAVDSFDDFCREAVEQCRNRLGFDRAGIWFFNKENPRMVIGTFGTDVNGQTLDERDMEMPTDQFWTEMYKVTNDDNAPVELEDKLLYIEGNLPDQLREIHVGRKTSNGNPLMERIVDGPFYDSTGKRAGGKGTIARCAIYDGSKIIGFISVDNYLHRRPFTEHNYQLLSLFASTFSHLFSQQRAEEALRKGEEAERRFQEKLKTLLDINIKLSMIDSFDDFCREAVEQCRNRLGFDRVGIWFYNRKDPNVVIGTFGTDEYGETRDERNHQITVEGPQKEIFTGLQQGSDAEISQNDTSIYRDLYNREDEVHWKAFSTHDKNVAIIFQDKPFYDTNGRHIGTGVGIWAGIWDGENVIGYVSVDNYFSRQPLTDHDYQLLAIFASSFGHLYSRRQAAEALKKAHDELEVRVERRTAELTTANKQLKQEITERKQAEESLHNKEEAERQFQQQLTNLMDMSVQLSKIGSFDDFCREAVEQARNRLGFDRVGIWLRNKDDPTTFIGTFGTDEHGRTYDERNIKVPINETVTEILKVKDDKGAAQSVDSKQVTIGDRSLAITSPVQLKRYPEIDSFLVALTREMSMHDTVTGQLIGSGSGTLTPIWDGEDLIGYITMDNMIRQRPITDHDCELVSLFASAFGQLCLRRWSEETHLKQMRKLTSDSEKKMEKEKATIARELHDEFGQLLTALNINLALTKNKLPANNKDVVERIDESTALVNQMTGSIRHLSKSLRPPLLDHKGLLDAIESYITEFSGRTGIQCHVTSKPKNLNIGDPLATTVYRILQEALTNVARHSKASFCDISIRLVNGTFEMSIQDNGRGAPPKKLSGTESLGIIGMQERAVALGGSVTIKNTPSNGICVTTYLPWQELKRKGKVHD